MLLSIRSGVTDLGMIALPSWRCQRRITCAGVRPWALGELADRLVFEQVALGERAPGLGDDPMLCMELAQL